MLRIASTALEADILPEVGGKIGQIRDLATGYEFLIPPQKPYRTIPPTGDWLQHDTSGMDDCFPNIAACACLDAPWNGTPLPDLGEWTHGEWQIAAHSMREVTLWRTGTALPYLATKTVRFADEHTLELSYRVENQGCFPIRYLWAAHPLIEVPESFELTLPPGALEVSTSPDAGKRSIWPYWNSIDLSRDWIEHGTTLKIFVTGLREGRCTLKLPSHTLRFHFDARQIPVLGIWLNHFGFPRGSARPFRCIAVEPCTSPTDLLGLPAPMTYPSIDAAAAAQWTVQLQILPN